MKKSDALVRPPEHIQEVAYRTIGKGDRPVLSVEFVSRNIKSVLGYGQNEFLKDAHLWNSLIHSDDLESVKRKRLSVFKSGKKATLVYRMRVRKSGAYIWVEDKFRPVRDGSGKAIGLEGSFVDISERKRFELDLRESEERLRSVFDEATIGMYRTTPDGRILMANKALVKLLGYKNFAELSDRNLNDKGYEPQYPRNDFCKRIEKDGSIRGFEATWVGKNGKTIYARESAHVVRDGEGKVLYYEGTVEDISEKKKDEEKTRRVNQILKMVSGVGQLIIHESDQGRLLSEACKTIVAEGGYTMVWIGILDDKTMAVKTGACAGDEDGYLKKLSLTSEDTPEGNGPVGKAIRTGKASICEDVENDPSFKLWRDAALKSGFKSVGAFPMRVRRSVVGSLNVYTQTKGCFSPEEIRLLSELADDIGFALWVVEARKQQEAADEVIRDREFWLEESQRVALVGSYIYDFNTRTWSSTPVLDELLGIDSSYRRDFRAWLDLIHPEDRAVLVSGIQRSVAQGKRFTSEFRIVRSSDNQSRWMWGTAEVRFDPRGRPAKLFGTVQDLTDRKRIEQELQNERILLRTLVDNLPSSIYIKDLEYKKILVNPMNVKHAGKSTESEVLGKTDFELYPKDVAEHFYEDDRNVIEHGERVIDREEFSFDGDGTKRWQLTSKIPLKDERGKTVGLIGIGTDITERKKAEEEKQRERSLLKTLFDHLPVSIWVKDKNFRRTAVNKAHVARTALFSGKPGLKESDFLGKTDFDIYDRKNAEEFFREDQAVIAEGKTVLGREELVFDSKGTRHWQLVSKVPLMDDEGNITGLIGIVTDITKQKEAEEANARGRELLRTIIDNIPNAIFVKDKELRKLIANPSHVRRVGSSLGKKIDSESELIGKTDSEVYPESMAKSFVGEDERILRDGLAVVNREQHSVDPDGQEKWELISKLPLRDKTGEIIGLVGIASEITEQKRVEDALRHERILLRTIIDHIPNGIFAKDNEYRKILVNPAHVEIMSRRIGPHTAEELLGKTDFEVCPPELAEEYRREDEKVLREGKSTINQPHSEVDGSGKRHWELISRIPMRDERGIIIGMVAVSNDVTTIREAEEKMAESESRFRLLAENAKDMVFRYAVKPVPHFEYVSPSCTEINGYTPEEHYADPALIVNVIYPDDRVSLAELGEKARSSRDPLTLRWVRKDGGIIWVEIQSRQTFDDERNVTAFEGIVRDITERKKTEEALRASQQTIDRITTSITDVIYSVNGATGEFEYLSPAFEKVLGYSVDDIVRMGGRRKFLMSVMEREDPSKPDPVMNEMQNARVVATSGWERWWKCKDGSRRFIEDYSVPIFDGDRLVRIDGVLRDITERKLAEDEVERERILLRTLIDNFPYSIYVKDRDCRKIIANDVDVKNFAGLSSEAEIIGKTDLDIYPREIGEKLLADDRRVIRTGESIVGKEELVVDAAGREHWLLTTKVPLRGNDGSINGLVGVGLDVTEKRAVDEALRRSEAELRALFESMNDVIMVIDSAGNYLKIAPTDPSLLYRPAEEITGKNLFGVLPKDRAEQFFGVITETLRDRKTHGVEYSLDINGAEKWRSASVSPMTDDSVIWVARDITEHKAMEKEIVDSEKKYRELVENALVGVYKINLSGTIVYVNKAMADMLEFDSPHEMMSVSALSLYRNIEDMSSLVDELRQFGKTGKNREIEMVTKSGKVRNVLISASLDQGVISGMAKDITEIRTLERQFIQTQKLEGLGNIAAGIAHDFNNILGVILGYSDLLGASSYEPDKFKRGMQAIAKSADRGKSLVRQLLTFARKTEVTFESLTLNSAVTEIEKLMVETFPRTIEFSAELDKDLPPVLADATQIHQVLLNLCVNARDAMPKGGTLTITTGVIPGPSITDLHPDATSDEYVEVQIADTGLGMDEATRQKIFEPFFTTKGIGRGTGLGLSVVYGIVESHRGFIDVQSEPGAGTTFKLYFPVLQHPIEAMDLANESPGGFGGQVGTILVVEDEEMLRELLRSILTSKGHELLLAKDGEEGVEVFIKNKDRIDLVISDLGLPKLSGEEVVSRIRKISPQMKIAVASGFIAPEVKAVLDEEGVEHFVQKPYRAAEVLRTVNEMIANSET